MQCSSENTLPEAKHEPPSSPNQLKRRKRSVDSISTDFEEDGSQSTENPSKEMVLYKPGTDDDIKKEQVQDLKGHKSLSLPRISPSIGAFTVQCSRCFHWRLIPTKEKYEEIREKILDDPFFCEKAKEWGRDISCDDASDISQDSSRLWAIDKPGIARPPSGWERLLRIRGEGGVKFADVYYVAPCGKRMRSTIEVQKEEGQIWRWSLSTNVHKFARGPTWTATKRHKRKYCSRYLSEHPEYLKQGADLSQFSFQCPKPLQENYLRKRPARLPAPADDSIALETPKPSTDVLFGGNPLSPAGQDACTDLQVGRPESSTLLTKKKLSKSFKKQMDDSKATPSHLDVKDESYFS